MKNPDSIPFKNLHVIHIIWRFEIVFQQIFRREASSIDYFVAPSVYSRVRWVSIASHSTWNSDNSKSIFSDGNDDYFFVILLNCLLWRKTITRVSREIFKQEDGK